MGHIDHGKTTLLDKIRKTHIAAKESGGITQHIGAYQIDFISKDGSNEKITFIDTPGHAAFAKMRARGAGVTDIVVLVVAADDGVMAQTKESLSHINAAGVPFLVAITKIDLAPTLVDKVKGQLLEIGVIPEDYGGNITVIPVSAKTGEGVDDLLEMIILMGKVEGLKADPNGDLEAVIIESSLDSRRGAVATAIIKNGTLRERDEAWAGDVQFKVKAMFDEKRKLIKEAFPSQPVEILGFETPPIAGTVISRSCQEEIGKEVQLSPGVEKQETVQGTQEENDIFSEKKKNELPVIIKGDVSGTLEAILSNFPPEVKVVYAAVGDVSDSDVFLAQTMGATIYAFRSKASGAIKKLAQDSNIVIKEFEIIYDLFEEIENKVLRLLEPRLDQEILGKAEIITEFMFDNKKIAGCHVTEGRISKKDKSYIQRGKDLITEVKIHSMKHLKESIDVANKGQEFGAYLGRNIDFKPGDVIVSYH